MEEFISIGPDALGANSWKLVLDWCTAATQIDTGGGSMVAIGVEAPFSTEVGWVFRGQEHPAGAVHAG